MTPRLDKRPTNKNHQSSIKRRCVKLDGAFHYSDLGIKKLRGMIHSGQLPAIKLGKYFLVDLADLDAILDAHKVIYVPEAGQNIPAVNWTPEGGAS